MLRTPDKDRARSARRTSVDVPNTGTSRPRCTFNHPGTPATLSEAFRKYYGPTMNAFDAAEKNGKAAKLQRELEELFNRENKSAHKNATEIPATFLRVTIAR